MSSSSESVFVRAAISTVEDPRRGERNFWTQRRDAGIGLRDRKCHRRPKERNDTGENPHRNGLSRVGVGICGLEGLDGGDGRDQTANPPPSHRTGLWNPSQERKFSMQRRERKKRRSAS